MRRDIIQLIRYRPAQIITLVTLFVSAVIALDLLPALRGVAGEWQWTHNSLDFIPWRLIFPIIIALALYRISTPSIQSPISNLYLLIFAVLSLTLRLSLQALTANSFSIIARTLNPSYFGYFPPAAAIDDLVKFLRDFTQAQLTLPYYRLATHPPGGMIFHWLNIQLVKIFPVQLLDPILAPRLASLPSWINDYTLPEVIAGAAASLTIPFLSSLSLVPLYHLARALWDERVARLAILLYSFIPALTVFTPVFDDAFTLITSLTLYFTVVGIKNQKRVQLFLAGLICGAGLFASFGLLPLLLIINLYSLIIAPRRIIGNGITLAIGGVTVWTLAWITFDLNPFVIYSNSMSEHAILTTTRSYWTWLIYNPYDVLLFAGVPISILFLGCLIRCCRQLFVERSPSSADHLLIAFVITFIFILISGNLRGETARVLLFVQPILALFAARELTPHPFGSRIRLYAILIITLLLIQTITFQTTLSVYH